MEKRGLLIFGIMLVLFVSLVSAIYQEEQDLVDIEHPIRVQEISMIPENIKPGEPGIINIKLINNAKAEVNDMIARLDLPSGINPFNDVNVVKISQLDAFESRDFEFKIIVSPGVSEGIYKTNLVVDYTSHFGVNFVGVGEEQQDNFSFGIVVRSDPIIFVEVEKSTVYRGKETGAVTIKFVNNDLADIKFLTVELEEGEDFKIISKNKEYVGDLDSDDFESVEFRIRAKKSKGEIKLPLKITYKDAMNNDYEDELETTFQMHSAEELGIEKKNTFIYLLLFILIVGMGYYIYKRFFKKKRQALN